MKGKKVKNPLSKMVNRENVVKMFGENITEQLFTKPVYKYTHKGMGEGLGDMRNSSN